MARWGGRCCGWSALPLTAPRSLSPYPHSPHSGELKDIVAVPTSIATYNQAKGEAEERESEEK